MNPGKVFEEDFYNSALPHVSNGMLSIDRFYDVLGGRKGIRTICDYVVYVYPTQCYFELKSYQGQSIPFDAFSDYQLEGLLGKSKIHGVVAGGLLKFRIDTKVSICYFIEINNILKLRDTCGRKSISVSMASDCGILMPHIQKRTRCTYDILTFMRNLKEVDEWR